MVSIPYQDNEKDADIAFMQKLVPPRQFVNRKILNSEYQVESYRFPDKVWFRSSIEEVHSLQECNASGEDSCEHAIFFGESPDFSIRISLWERRPFWNTRLTGFLGVIWHTQCMTIFP
jgi:hypothetical protein